MYIISPFNYIYIHIYRYIYIYMCSQYVQYIFLTIEYLNRVSHPWKLPAKNQHILGKQAAWNMEQLEIDVYFHVEKRISMDFWLSLLWCCFLLEFHPTLLGDTKNMLLYNYISMSIPLKTPVQSFHIVRHFRARSIAEIHHRCQSTGAEKPRVVHETYQCGEHLHRNRWQWEVRGHRYRSTTSTRCTETGLWTSATAREVT